LENGGGGFCSVSRFQRDGVGRFVLLAAVCVLFTARSSAQLRPDPAALASVPTELIEHLRADPFTYFRFINRAWTARVCQAFADVHDVPIVRLHGDAHVEQFALTQDAWGLVDFDDSARGPAYVDIVRYLGSIELAVRQRGWASRRNALWNRFLEGYRQGLETPDYRPPEPDSVRRLRAQAPMTRAAFLGWAEQQMQPMDEITSKSVVAGMAEFERFMRAERADLRPGYFGVAHAGWLRIGVGSAAIRKVLIRVQGPTSDADDDVVLELKEFVNLRGFGCLEGQTDTTALRIIDGTRQLGRVKHDILAVGPTLLIPAAADRAEPWLDWWVASWEPTYREVRLSDLRSVEDLSDIVYDSGVQLGAGATQDASVRSQALAWVARLADRLKREASTIVDELIAGWRELQGR
jgi:Uncharacterized protein conserved in bacteria (DUF2252)